MHNPISWHIEPTSRCTLECPGCDRTWFKKTFRSQLIQDINVDDLINFFSKNNFLESKISLCGNNGDPIYHPQFLKLVTKLKLQRHTLTIHTNGSAKTTKFWQQICSVLDKDDNIVFAIDGLQDTNHLYRKNADWQQIMNAIDVATSFKSQTEWQFIVFKHNQHQIKQAEKMSKQLGMSSFKLFKSYRWLDASLHQYMPDEPYIHNDYANQMDTINTDTEKLIKPLCGQNKGIYIDSNGDIYPCCWSGSYRFRRKHAFGKNPINIKQKRYKLPNAHVHFLNSTKSWNSAHLVCKMHCAK